MNEELDKIKTFKKYESEKKVLNNEQIQATDPLNITFNKNGNKSMLSDWPYRNIKEPSTTSISWSEKKNKKMKETPSSESENFMSKIILFEPHSDGQIALDNEGKLSKSDNTTPNKSALLTDVQKDTEKLENPSSVVHKKSNKNVTNA